MASRILAFCLFLWRATAKEHCSGAGCAFDAELTGSSVVLLQQQKQARHSANAAATWTAYPGVNCYSGYGSQGIAGKDPVSGDLSENQCKAECLNDALCDGIVMPQGSEPRTCWLRQGTTLEDCAKGTGYDFWARTGGAAPPASTTAPRTTTQAPPQTSQALPENCVGQSTKEDETRPIKEVLAEHGNPDGYCYFKNNPFYINPSAEQDFRKRGQMGVDTLRNWALTCKQPFREGSGRSVTWTGDWGDASTDNLDCSFYNQDLIYCYTFGWLRNQHLDSSLITNNTAWIELAGKECDDMQNKFQFADEEVTIARMKHENEVTGRLTNGAVCSQKKGCQNPITSRELAMHVYPKCLLSLEHGAASEMAYCQQLGCVLPDDQKGAKKIGTGSQCEPL